MQILPIVRLSELQSMELMKTVTREAGVYQVPMMITGTAILSSLYVRTMAPGTQIKAKYFDYTTGSLLTEYYELGSHTTVTPDLIDAEFGYTERKSILHIHNKPNLEVEVIGGACEFGVYATVVTSNASDLDETLKREDSTASTVSKGMPIMSVEDGTFKFIKTSTGRLPVDVFNEVATIDITINKRLYAINLAADPEELITHISYTVPSGKSFYWISGFGTSNCYCEWRIFLNGVAFLTKRNHHVAPNVDLSLGKSMILTAGDVLEIKIMNKSIENNTAEVESFIYGNEHI